MPLPPLPEDNTPRLFVNYVALGNLRHTVQLRPITGFTLADLTTWFRSWLQTNAALFAETTIFDSADVSEINSGVRNPIEWEPIEGSGTPPSFVNMDTWMCAFTGREVTGRRSRMSFYGTVFGPDVNYRVNVADSAIILAAVNGLNALNSRTGGITGAKLSWKQYANFRYNAYWQDALRS